MGHINVNLKFLRGSGPNLLHFTSKRYVIVSPCRFLFACRCMVDQWVFGRAAPGAVRSQGDTQERLSKLKAISSQSKIYVTSKSPVGDISVVTLIRTDTTLDHSQKAEKVCYDAHGFLIVSRLFVQLGARLCFSCKTLTHRGEKKTLGKHDGAQFCRSASVFVLQICHRLSLHSQAAQSWWLLGSKPPLKKFCYG